MKRSVIWKMLGPLFMWLLVAMKFLFGMQRTRVATRYEVIVLYLFIDR